MSEDIEIDRKREAGHLAKAIEVSIKAMMETYEGRWFLSYVMDTANPMQRRYLMNGDVNGAIWRDGRASVGEDFLMWIEAHAPDKYALLIRERRKRIERERSRQTVQGEEDMSDIFAEIRNAQKTTPAR